MIAISQSIAPEKYGIQSFTSYNRFCLLCLFTFWSLFCFTLIIYPTLPYYFHSSPSHNLHLLRPVCDLQFLSLNECYFWRQSWSGILWDIIFLFLFLFSPFFPFSCWMSSTLTNNLIWIFVAFVIMIVSFALGLIFWQLLPEILTKSYQILNDLLNDIWNWSYNNPIS